MAFCSSDSMKKYFSGLPDAVLLAFDCITDEQHAKIASNTQSIEEILTVFKLALVILEADTRDPEALSALRDKIKGSGNHD